VHGVSTRSVDDLVAALGGHRDLEVRGVEDLRRLDERVGVPGPHPRATRLPVRVPGRHLPARPRRRPGQVVSKAVVVATGVTATATGRSWASTSATARTRRSGPGSCGRCVKDRGLSGVRLVISDAARRAQVKRSARCFAGSAHQRCRVHFARNLLATGPQVPQGHGRRRCSARSSPSPTPSVHARLGRGARPARRPVPEDRPLDGDAKGRGPGVHRVPADALAQDLVQQTPSSG
jgi:transposase-like protein